MIETYKLEIWIMMEILYVGRLVEVVIVTLLFKIHITQKMGSLYHVARLW
jgi:uncharacterized paraquat-inducible protein A